MSTLDDSLSAGQIQLLDYCQPGLQGGTYQLSVTQEVAVATEPIPSVTQTFVVAGPRFRLDPAEVHAQYPPHGASGTFADNLPHVVLNKRVLPWERAIPNLSTQPAALPVPWLALLVFEEGELLDPAGQGTYVQTMTVTDLLTPDSTVRVPDIALGELSTDEQQSSCTVITLSSATFAQLVPTARELPYLAHVRQVDVGAKVLLTMPNQGQFSVVVANRFPMAMLTGGATYAAKNTVHLVSLEGFGDLLGGKVPVQAAPASIRLVSLYNWTFSCLANPSQTFAGLAGNLTGANNDLALRLPFTPTTDAATQAVQSRLTSGYVALSYHDRVGDAGLAWYRGPFAACIPETVATAPALPTADAAMIYDATTGTFDQRLAAAWQCGRTLALADQTYATTLLRLRRLASELLDQQSMPGGATLGARQRAMQQQLAGLFGAGLLTTIRQASHANHLPAPTRRRGARVPSASPAAVQASLAQPVVVASLQELLVAAEEVINTASWLGKLRLLSGVPFVHLVPDARMLPPESIRFFYLDLSWIAALTAGALSIGCSSSRDVALQATLTGLLEQVAASTAQAARATALGQPVPAPASGPATGFLLRSALVAGWPGLTAHATVGAERTPVALLRLEQLAPGVLLALFNGAPDTVWLEEPHEGLVFGVDENNDIATRTVAGSTVTSATGPAIYNPLTQTSALPTLRPTGARVLNLNIDPNYPASAPPTAPVDLLGELAQALSVGTALVGPACFALQLLKGPETVTFTL